IKIFNNLLLIREFLQEYRMFCLTDRTIARMEAKDLMNCIRLLFPQCLLLVAAVKFFSRSRRLKEVSEGFFHGPTLGFQILDTTLTDSSLSFLLGHQLIKLRLHRHNLILESVVVLFDLGSF